MRFLSEQTNTKLREYFKNSRTRVGVWWMLTHVFFLLLGMMSVIILLNSGHFRPWDTLLFAGILAWYFPLMIFGAFALLLASVFSSDVVIGISMRTVETFFIFLIPSLYYLLFILVVVFAKDTSSKKFRICHAIFRIVFLLNIIICLVVLAYAWWFFLNHGLRSVVFD